MALFNGLEKYILNLEAMIILIVKYFAFLQYFPCFATYVHKLSITRGKIQQAIVRWNTLSLPKTNLFPLKIE